MLQLAMSRGALDGLFLGAKNAGKDYGWIDGSAWDYQNFYDESTNVRVFQMFDEGGMDAEWRF